MKKQKLIQEYTYTRSKSRSVYGVQRQPEVQKLVDANHSQAQQVNISAMGRLTKLLLQSRARTPLLKRHPDFYNITDLPYEGIWMLIKWLYCRPSPSLHSSQSPFYATDCNGETCKVSLLLSEVQKMMRILLHQQQQKKDIKIVAGNQNIQQLTLDS